LISAGARLVAAAAVVSGSAVICDPPPAGCHQPPADKLAAVPGNFPILGSFALSVSPVYGKLNLLAEQVVHFDLYMSIGAAFILVNPATAGGVISVGQRYVLSRSVALRLEFSDYIYSAGTPDAFMQHQFMFDLGVSFFLG
jgi:hypothetical protein